jgi:uncharacterized protein
MAEMEWYDWVATGLVLVGAINWGLVGAFDWNLVEALFKTWSRAIYILVGIAAIFSVYRLASN